MCGRMGGHYELFLTKFEDDFALKSLLIREEWAKIGQLGFVKLTKSSYINKFFSFGL